MIIDGHGHVCGEYLELESIKDKLKKSHVDMVVLTPGETNSTKTYKLMDITKIKNYSATVTTMNKVIGTITKIRGAKKGIPLGNEYIYELKKQAPNQIKHYYWIIKDRWQEIEEDYRKMQFEGIKLHQCWERFDIASPWFEEIVEWAVAKDLPLFIHIHDYKQVEKMIQFIKCHPKAKIIIAHMYGAELYMEEELRYMENIYFDLSNSYFVSYDRIMNLYKRIGSTKLLLGSDTPYGKNALEHTIKRIDELGISSVEKDNILGNNLRCLLKI